MFTSIVCATLMLNPLSLDLAKSYIQEENYEKAEKVLKFQPTPSQYNDFYYYSLICHFRLNEKELVKKDLKALADSFYVFPRRQQSMIFLISHEILTWEKDNLADIMRDMSKSRDKLSAGEVDRTTQKIQKDIVDKLNKFIEEKEGGGKSPPSDPNNPNLTKPKSGQPSTGDSPLPDSILGGPGGKGQLTERKLNQVAQQWGGLPPMERERIVRELTRDIPPKYKEMCDAYFKSLSKVK